MAEKGDVYVLDEPTTGLHLADVENLLGLLDRLVDSGKSVIVIEHHQAVMAHADWIIDLGPGAGHDGGKVVFEGTAADLVADGSDPHRRAPGGVRRQLTALGSRAREDDELLGRAGHRHIAVDSSLDALAEALRFDQHDQVELQSLGQLGRQ